MGQNYGMFAAAFVYAGYLLLRDARGREAMTKYLEIKQLCLPTLAPEKNSTLWYTYRTFKNVYISFTLLIQHLQADKRRLKDEGDLLLNSS